MTVGTPAKCPLEPGITLPHHTSHSNTATLQGTCLTPIEWRGKLRHGSHSIRAKARIQTPVSLLSQVVSWWYYLREMLLQENCGVWGHREKTVAPGRQRQAALEQTSLV